MKSQSYTEKMMTTQQSDREKEPSLFLLYPPYPPTFALVFEESYRLYPFHRNSV